MFDNPIFWIVVIWWLLTTFLGGKARRKRRSQRSQQRQSPPAGSKFGAPTRPAQPQEEPGSFTEAEFEAEEVEPEYSPPPQPTPFFGPTKPVTSLEDLWQRLGRITQEEAPLEVIPDEPIVVEPIPPPPDPVPVPDVPAPAVTSFWDASSPDQEDDDRLNRAVASLTPLQQAVVLNEILDRPRALRRGIR